MKAVLRFFKSPTEKNPHYTLLRNSGIDWTEYADGLPFDVDDPVLHFLENYEKNPLVVSGWFDSTYYLEMNPDVRRDGANPLVHFLIYGQSEGRPAWMDEDTSSAGEDVVPTDNLVVELDPGSVLKRRLKTLLRDQGQIPTDFDAERLSRWIDDLVEVSQYGKAVIEGFFDQSLYEAIYPDISAAPINSFHHFVNHGYAEGRAGWLDLDEMLTEGGLERNAALETVLVVSHDASATGAPVVALEVARRLAKHFNIVTASLKGGALRSHFLEASVAHLDAPGDRGVGTLEYCLKRVVERTGVSAVLLNSVESIDMADAAARLGLPTVSLLHEFAEYTRPVGKIGRMILTSDLIVYPAESLKKSGLRELRAKAGIKNQPNHLRIQPQGYLGFKTHSDDDWVLRQYLGLDKSDLVLVGAGHIQPRKGVDWFLETCHHLREVLRDQKDERAERLQFVWLGDGHHENDTNVSVWLDTYIQRKGLEEIVHFPGAVHDVASALSDADLFLLTSRLDPFPNVAVDALNADCGIGLFEEASGIADFLQEHSARAVLGKYGDPRDLAEKLAENLDELISRDGKNSQICKRNLDFETYVNTIRRLMAEATDRRQEIDQAIASDIFDRHFDSDFYGLAFAPEGNREDYFLSLLRKGVALAKPFPGSDVQTVLDDASPEDDFEALVEKVMTTKVIDMPVQRLTGVGTEEIYKGRIALQFHVFFADLIPEYCAYFRSLADHNVDLFVTHVPELTELQVEELENAVTGNLHLKRIENRGRDVYPFHRQFVEEIHGNYDLVGHFHTKKSSDNAKGVGDRWRRYLLANLMGSREACNEALGFFLEQDTGLVFAEDSHLVDEGGNGPFIEKLLEPLGLKRWDHYRHFPLGTMFWARTEALEALLEWPCDIFDLPEPVPYDGSVLHAFERILPQLVKAAGFEVKRVYTSGTHW
ncbi:glycosyltransferase [Marinobacter nauticus]|uniref:rhamnan synthesis F family protein n=1 Tax=Marinobacter nauticus TaxID=2743 RepID=UPI001D18CA48|nr:rhamnan synthesis F family protein [Marinobacter nauticus]MCC4270456.1 glycosyltransferase [Marinobacter nauticus]